LFDTNDRQTSLLIFTYSCSLTCQPYVHHIHCHYHFTLSTVCYYLFLQTTFYFTFPLSIFFLVSTLNQNSNVSVAYLRDTGCRGSAVSIATYATGWAVRGSNPERGRRFLFSPKRPTSLGAHPASYSMSTGFISRRQSGWGVNLTTHFHLVPKILMNETTPLLPLCAFMAWTGETSLFLLYLHDIKLSAHFRLFQLLLAANSNTKRSLSDWWRNETNFLPFHQLYQVLRRPKP
jgi:hypothetical protein